jgi:hypothetical protein
MLKNICQISLVYIVSVFFVQPVFGQTEAEPWGNITGIRIDGQLMAFESNISVVQKDWAQVTAYFI